MLLAERVLAGPDWFILVGYFALMLFIGYYFARYMKGVKEYFSGGNRLPWWLAGVSFYMASFSAFAFVSYSALAYQYGFVAVTALGVTVPATLLGVILFAARWRRARIDSPVEYLEARYSHAVRQVFAWQGVPVKVVDDALKLIATGAFLSVVLRRDLTYSIICSGLIVLAYTFLGGLWAVAVTDFIQFVVLAAAVLLLVPMSVSAAGGWSQFRQASPPGFFHLTAGDYSPAFIACLVLLYCIAFSSTNWSLIQRYFCVPREGDARKVGWTVIVLYLIGTPLMFLPAMAARHFLPALDDTKWVYPSLCVYLLPAGMLGLIIAAMFSATMSTLSSDYNVCANVLTTDVYRRLIRPEASQGELVFVGRLMTLVVGLASLGVALLMLGSSKGEQLFDNMVTLFGLAAPLAGVPMLWGLLSRRCSTGGALAGFVCGLAVGLWVFLAHGATITFENPVWRLLHLGGVTMKTQSVLILSTTLTTSLAMIVGSFLWPGATDERRRAEEFLVRVKTPIGALPEDERILAGEHKGVSPFGIVGFCTLAIGVMLLAILPWAGEALWIDLALGAALAVIGWLVMRRSPRPVAESQLQETAA